MSPPPVTEKNKPRLKPTADPPGVVCTGEAWCNWRQLLTVKNTLDPKTSKQQHPFVGTCYVDGDRYTKDATNSWISKLSLASWWHVWCHSSFAFRSNGTTPGAPSLVSHRLPVNFCKGKLFNFVGPIQTEHLWSCGMSQSEQTRLPRHQQVLQLCQPLPHGLAQWSIPFSHDRQWKFIRQDPPLPRPPFAPRPRPFPGVKVRLSKSPKHKAVHNPQPNPTAFTSATKGACHLFVLSKKNAGNRRVFWKGFQGYVQPLKLAPPKWTLARHLQRRGVPWSLLQRP